MSKCRLLGLMTASILVILACAALPFLLAQPIRIIEANCNRIQPGMTQRDVEAILGAPPGDYETGRRAVVLDLYGNGVLMREGRREEWGGNEGFIQVGFDDSDTVVWTRFISAGCRWTRIGQWLGRSFWQQCQP